MKAGEGGSAGVDGADCEPGLERLQIEFVADFGESVNGFAKNLHIGTGDDALHLRGRTPGGFFRKDLFKRHLLF